MLKGVVTSYNMGLANSVPDANKFKLDKRRCAPGTKAISKDRQVHYGISGSLGDSGMSYAVNGADFQNDTTPWSFNVSIRTLAAERVWRSNTSTMMVVRLARLKTSLLFG